jgi:hypothetical protein
VWVADLRYVLYETKGELTIVREPGGGAPDPELVRVGLHAAAAYPPRTCDRAGKHQHVAELRRRGSCPAA